jgi:restriction system protein
MTQRSKVAIPIDMPPIKDLYFPLLTTLDKLGGSGNNEEIADEFSASLPIPEELKIFPHLNSITKTELVYRMEWAKTRLKKAGIITNSKRSVWSFSPSFSVNRFATPVELLAFIQNQRSDDGISLPRLPEYKDTDAWQDQVNKVLLAMNPYAFERLIQRLLRESGFVQVQVTKRSGDCGIDGKGKMQIGMLRFSVAFQCKRYTSPVGSPVVRDFRGSLSSEYEKGIIYTTSTYTREAKEEASKPGAAQIDLVDGKELVELLAKYQIGLKPIVSYEIDEQFFSQI